MSNEIVVGLDGSLSSKLAFAVGGRACEKHKCSIACSARVLRGAEGDLMIDPEGLA